MKGWWLAAIIALGSAQAQGVLDGALEALAQLCQAGSTLSSDSLTLVCSSVATIRDTKAKLAGIGQDLEGLWQRGVRQAVGSGLDRIGAELGLEQVGRWVAQLDQAMNTGYAALLQVTGAVTGEAREGAIRRLFAPPADPQSPAGLAARAIQTNPNLAAKGLLGVEAQSKAVGDLALSVATTREGAERLKAATQRITGEQTQNLTALTTPTQQGIADKIRSRAANAVSTRAAIQSWAEGQADLALQQATGFNQILAAQQDGLLLQALTVRQMGLLVEQYIAERQERLAAWRGRFEQDMDALYQQSEARAEDFRSLATALENLVK